MAWRMMMSKNLDQFSQNSLFKGEVQNASGEPSIPLHSDRRTSR
jgi:hypothetical protein